MRSTLFLSVPVSRKKHSAESFLGHTCIGRSALDGLRSDVGSQKDLSYFSTDTVDDQQGSTNLQN